MVAMKMMMAKAGTTGMKMRKIRKNKLAGSWKKSRKSENRPQQSRTIWL